MRLGVIECFFGSPWSMAERTSWARFLSENQLDFYIYAPKADANLRKKWREEWSASYLDQLKYLSVVFRKNKIEFGIALSPFQFDFKTDFPILKQRIRQLDELGIDLLGIFFDDMNYHEGQIDVQLAILNVARAETQAKIVFCPTYYSYDPILDKVFGQRPDNYLQQIGKAVPSDIDIVWTGPKVISDEISALHIDEISEVLKRKPFICDNFFANDGPKNCKYLKLKSPDGRSNGSFQGSSHWGINPMNQSNLSKIVCLAEKFALREKISGDVSLTRAIDRVCSPELAVIVQKYKNIFCHEGLDKMSVHTRQDLLAQIQKFNEPVATDIIRWLNHEFVVGSDCLTD